MTIYERSDFNFNMPKLGYVVENQTAALTADGEYPHVVIWGKKHFQIKFSLLQKVDAQTLQHINEQMSGLAQGAIVTLRGESHVIITMPRSPSISTSVLLDIINRCSVIFKKSGYLLPTSCPLCGEDRCDSYAIVKGEARLVHATCVNREGIKKDKPISSKYSIDMLKGLLGAFLGMLVGVVINVLLEKIIFSSWYAMAVLPIAITFGFRLLSKIRGRTVIVTTIIMSIIALFAIDIFGTYFIYTAIDEAYVDEVVFKGSFLEFIPYYFINFYDMLSSFFSRLGSMAFGLFISWRFILRKSYETEYVGYMHPAGLPPERVIIPLVLSKKTDLPEGYSSFKSK